MAEGVGFEPTVGCPTLDFESSALNRTQPSLHFVPGDFVLRINVLRTLCGYAPLSTTTFVARHAAIPPLHSGRLRPPEEANPTQFHESFKTHFSG